MLQQFPWLIFQLKDKTLLQKNPLQEVACVFFSLHMFWDNQTALRRQVIASTHEE